MLHLLIKVAEGLSVGTVVLGGSYNGMQEYKRVGRTLRDAFWVAIVTGAIIASLLFFGAYWIYRVYGISADMIPLATPYLRLRAVGIFLMFIAFSFIGFLRSVKNTRAAMMIFASGVVTFVFFDYILIFGMLGFPAMGLQGSAMASILCSSRARLHS